MAKLSDNDIQESLRTLSGWKYQEGALVREYTFTNFDEAFAFATRLALKAAKADHHPDIDIRYNKIRVSLTSHDAGGVTERDISMAGAVEKLG